MMTLCHRQEKEMRGNELLKEGEKGRKSEKEYEGER